MFNLLEKYRLFLIYIPLILYGIILIVFSVLPDNILLNSNSPDKFYHLGAYGIFSFFLFFCLNFQNKIFVFKKYASVFTVVLTSLFGILNEFYQIFIPGRTLNILDVIANMVGSLIVVLLVQFFLIITKTQKEY